MKNLLSILLGLFLMVSFNVRSQDSKEYCEEVTHSATKLAKKVKKKHVLNASKNYSSALIAIEKAKTNYPNQEFGYDKLVSEIPSWIRMYKALAKLDGTKIVDKKGNTFEFAIVDYVPLKEEATIKAGEAHYNAGVKLMASANFDDVKKGFDQFHYAHTYVNTYDAEIENYTLEAYYAQGVKVLNSSNEFSKKEQSIAYFNKALAIKNPYKDVNDLCADLYYVEGTRLSKEKTLEELKNSVVYLRKSLNYKDNKEAVAMIDANLNTGAEIIYQMAVEQEKVETFEAQAQAAKTFKACDGWVEGYKDSVKRGIEANNRSHVSLVLVGADGKVVVDGGLVDGMNKELNKTFYFGMYDYDLGDLNLNDPANYAKAANNIMGTNYFIYIKFGESQGGKFYTQAPKVTEQLLTSYHAQEKGKAAKQVSKKEWEDGKKADDLTGHTSGMKFFTYSGTVKTITESTSYSINYTIDIIDARIPDAPVKVGSIVVTKSYFDNRKKQTFTGDSQAKPPLSDGSGSLLTEAGFKAQIAKEKTDIVSLLETVTGITPKYMEIVKLLNANIEYVSMK